MGDFCVGLAFLCLYLARIKPAVPWIRSVQTECSIGHAEFRIFQTGFFVEWKALEIFLSVTPTKKIRSDSSKGKRKDVKGQN